MISDDSALKEGFNFNYSEAQWKAIRECVSGLPNQYNYDFLLEVANWYLSHPERDLRQRSRVQRCASWVKVALLARALQDALEDADDPDDSFISGSCKDHVALMGMLRDLEEISDRTAQFY